MNSELPETRRFDVWNQFISSVSLFVSITLAFPIIGNLRSGFYGGTALILAFVIAGQILVFAAAVILPLVVLFFRRRLRMSRLGWLLFAVALAALASEAAAVLLIPVTGNC